MFNESILVDYIYSLINLTLTVCPMQYSILSNLVRRKISVVTQASLSLSLSALWPGVVVVPHEYSPYIWIENRGGI